MHPVCSTLLPRREFLKTSASAGAGTLAASLLFDNLFGKSLRAASNPADSLVAKISVDAGKVQNRIDTRIYGTLMEHIGRVVYGGVFEEGSPLSDDQGFRKDVVAAARDWGVTVLRWPGGDFASQYHWEDGVGPRATRARKYNAAWLEEEGNHFGT